MKAARPMRLDDLLFSQGFGTRRECAGLIARGLVRVGGQAALPTRRGGVPVVATMPAVPGPADPSAG